MKEDDEVSLEWALVLEWTDEWGSVREQGGSVMFPWAFITPIISFPCYSSM